MIALNVRLHVSDYSQMSDYTVRYKAVSAPITFEEIVMVMIIGNHGCHIFWFSVKAGLVTVIRTKTHQEMSTIQNGKLGYEQISVYESL